MALNDPSPRTSPIAAKARDSASARHYARFTKKKRSKAANSVFSAAHKAFNAARKTGAKISSAGKIAKKNPRPGLYFTAKHHEDYLRLAGLLEWWRKKKKAADAPAPDDDGDPKSAAPAAPPKDPDDGEEKPLPPNKDGFVKGSKGKWPTKPDNYMGCSTEYSYIIRKRRVQE